MASRLSLPDSPAENGELVQSLSSSAPADPRLRRLTPEWRYRSQARPLTSHVSWVIRLGCTQAGSPGIFGVYDRLPVAPSVASRSAWSPGKKVLLPAGTIDRVDTDGGGVYLDLTKDQIKDSPEFDQSSYNEPAYRNRVGDYYGRYYTR